MKNLAMPLFAESLFDHMSDTSFFIKDPAGRYLSVNQGVLERLGLSSKAEALGKTARDLYPPHMAERYERQDARVFKTGQSVIDNLDMTVYPDGSAGWALTQKIPLRDHGGKIIALATFSRDLMEPSRAGLIDAAFADTIDFIQTHFQDHLRVEELAKMASLSLTQFDRRMKRIFGISALQFIIKTRIDAVSHALAHSDQPIADIAQEAGFCDQSALSRQFKLVTGLNPRQYRQLTRSEKKPA
ncbi:MAG: AraC family transcriptional regulator [Gammaproteobacteria bacterium]|nr:AraC family transcriptional regulator [Gammaproteobacteria bacterium]